MGQFSGGVPFTPGTGQVAGSGGIVASQQSVQRQALQAATFSTSYLGTGQAVLFGPFVGPYSLLYSRVTGPVSAYAYLFIGQGNLASIVVPENLEAFTVAGSGDEASWARPGLPIYDGWSVAIFWDKSLAWGQATGKIYVQQVAV